MRKFTVEIPHTLTAPEVRERLERAMSKLEADYGATCAWQSDAVMTVKRKGLDGRVAIEPDKLRVDVELGLLMAAMAGPLKEGITKRLTSLVTAAPPA